MYKYIYISMEVNYVHVHTRTVYIYKYKCIYLAVYLPSMTRYSNGYKWIWRYLSHRWAAVRDTVTETAATTAASPPTPMLYTHRNLYESPAMTTTDDRQHSTATTTTTILAFGRWWCFTPLWNGKQICIINIFLLINSIRLDRAYSCSSVCVVVVCVWMNACHDVHNALRRMINKVMLYLANSSSSRHEAK